MRCTIAALLVSTTSRGHPVGDGELHRVVGGGKDRRAHPADGDGAIGGAKASAGQGDVIPSGSRGRRDAGDADGSLGNPEEGEQGESKEDQTRANTQEKRVPRGGNASPTRTQRFSFHRLSSPPRYAVTCPGSGSPGEIYIFVLARKNSLCQIFASLWQDKRISIGKFNTIKWLQSSTQNTPIPRQLNSDSIKADRFKAGWDNDYLARVLFSE